MFEHIHIGMLPHCNKKSDRGWTVILLEFQHDGRTKKKVEFQYFDDFESRYTKRHFRGPPSCHLQYILYLPWLIWNLFLLCLAPPPFFPINLITFDGPLVALYSDFYDLRDIGQNMPKYTNYSINWLWIPESSPLPPYFPWQKLCPSPILQKRARGKPALWTDVKKWVNEK